MVFLESPSTQQDLSSERWLSLVDPSVVPVEDVFESLGRMVGPPVFTTILCLQISSV